jgi:hypothetical protein
MASFNLVCEQNNYNQLSVNSVVRLICATTGILVQIFAMIDTTVQ